MIVAELITILEKCNPNDRVMIYEGEFGRVNIACIKASIELPDITVLFPTFKDETGGGYEEDLSYE